MWLIDFLPNWIFSLLLMLGFIGLLVGKFIPTYGKLVQTVSVIAVVIGLYSAGAIANEDKWKLRVKELEAQLAKNNAEAQKENVKIVEKVVKRVEIVREKGKDVIQYVDREVVKYDNQCVVPKEFVKAHNDSVEASK